MTLKRAISLVRKGASYGEAASKLGLTRNQVAGACHRAGVKKGRDFEAERANSRLAAKLYQQGVLGREIVRLCGYSQNGGAAIYHSLRTRGITPNRRPRA